ncbi:IclR family transcriptional regulator [Bordetella sp. 02P26C-1]|uniref:IclR family transcriptional regulator n=1 Tax=Bordetella sp. 02P26C-1 TaxID=2683195 RepID=UPI0013534458|nr:IclR family transcriptional regulator [Bordetella sp. 02P26C-1]MVW78216.1 helix-turn-helix domain-containing protein [Bordetella sp. 02P26C-1]
MPRKAATPSLADTDAAQGGVAAVDRALSLMAVFQPGDIALSLGDFAERTKLYKSTALRLLASLEHGGWVQRLDDGRYALGGEIARLNAIYAASFSLEKVVVPVLRELVAATGESAAYHVRQGDDRLCLYRVDSPHPVRDHIRAGDLLPLTRGSGGRILTAYDPVLGFADGPDKDLYQRIRADGYFTAVGDRLTEVAGISAPVFFASGTLAAAVTLTAPAHRFDTKHLDAVLRAAKRLSKVVG